MTHVVVRQPLANDILEIQLTDRGLLGRDKSIYVVAPDGYSSTAPDEQKRAALVGAIREAQSAARDRNSDEKSNANVVTMMSGTVTVAGIFVAFAVGPLAVLIPGLVTAGAVMAPGFTRSARTERLADEALAATSFEFA